ncbi:hypothetical protein CUU62_24080 [Pseudomonas sp. WP001]|nr:hypothetical protein CUU62_24080 [Pseudomonas sp. WP001]
MGGGLPPIAVCQLAHQCLADCYRSIGNYTTFQTVAANGNHDAKRVALDLHLRRPAKPPWPNAGLNP